MATVVLASREQIWGGGEVFLHAVGLAMNERGHRVRWRVPADSALAKRIDPSALVARRRPVSGDVIIANDFRSVWESLLLDGLVSRRFVVHGDWQLSPVRSRIVDTFGVTPFGVSEQVKRASRQAGLKGDMHILPLGPDPSAVVFESSKPPPPPAVNFVIGTVARWDRIKRTELFCEVVRSCGVRGVLLAPTPSSAEEEAMRRRVDTFPEVEIIHGSAPDLWGRCDVFLSTSKRESLGLAHLEALAAGKLVMSTASNGPEDFLTGLLARGRLASGTPEGIGREIRGAIEECVEDWPAYLEQAARVLAGRGPEQCAADLLGDRW